MQSLVSTQVLWKNYPDGPNRVLSTTCLSHMTTKCGGLSGETSKTESQQRQHCKLPSLLKRPSKGRIWELFTDNFTSCIWVKNSRRERRKHTVNQSVALIDRCEVAHRASRTNFMFCTICWTDNICYKRVLKYYFQIQHYFKRITKDFHRCGRCRGLILYLKTKL